MAAVSAMPSASYAQSMSANTEGSNIIIVTATRRAEDLQDIPIAVTAVAAEELDRQGINDIRSLSSVSSSFNLNSSGSETAGTTIRIRGVGTTGNNPGLESAVGVFLDGVYLSRPSVALGDLVDVEQIEVLRGPQGTLFGRNTSAGALNITTRKPDLGEVDGFANASYGNYDFVNIQGGVGVPLIKDQLGFRISGSYRRRDGTATAGPTGARYEVNDRESHAIRGQLYWEPSSDVSIRLLADYSGVDADCCEAVQLRVSELFSNGLAFQANGLPADGGTPFVGIGEQETRRGNSTIDPTNRSNNIGLSGELNWDIGGSSKLTYIGSWRKFKTSISSDPDFSALDILTFGISPGLPSDSLFRDSFETWTQELRLQGDAWDDRIDWLIGAYYSNEKYRTGSNIIALGQHYEQVSNANLTVFGLPSLDTFAALATGGAVTNVDFNGAFADNRFSQDAESWSIFTHNSLALTNTLTATIGLRYTKDTKKAQFRQAAAQSDACETLLPALGATPLVGLICLPFSARADLPQAFDNPFTPAVGDGLALVRTFGGGAQGGRFDQFKDDELSYTANLAWQATPDINTYVSFSHGYKAGGYNLDPAASTLGADPRFSSETVDAYELGIKSRLFNGRGTFNIAVFHQDLSNFQVLEFTGINFQTFSVPKAASTGVEVEFQTRLSDQISTNIAMTYQDARYPNDCVAGIAAPNPVVASLCGHKLTNAPDFVGNFGLLFQDEINDAGWSINASANVRFETSRRTSTLATEASPPFVPLPFDIQEANVKANARIGVSSPNERITIEIWGKNIFDESTRNVTFNSALRGAPGFQSRSAFLEDPATYGVTIRTKF